MKPFRMVIPVFIIFFTVSAAALLAGRHITPPVSFSQMVLPDSSLDHRILASPDTGALLKEDMANLGKRIPRRVASPTSVRFTPGNSGTWEFLPDESELWRLRISSPGAVFMSLKISNFNLPPGAQLHLYSVEHNFHDGPYTFLNNNDEGRLGTPMIAGDSIVIELHLEPDLPTPMFVIDSISHGYKDAMGMASVPLRGEVVSPGSEPAPRAPFDCQRDVNCPEGAPYQNEKHSVSEGYDGVYICSGTLINNVREDCRNYYITANHCEWFLDPAGMTFYWDYENSTCGGNDAPLNTSSGSWTRFEGNAVDDITLMELYDNLDVHGVYYTGWTRDTTPATASAVLGFPSDKPMQVSIDTDTLIDCEATPALCSGGWGPQYWRIDSYEVGVTEGGSSGGGLMDQNNRIVGILSGGIGTNCVNFDWDEYGKFYDSMNKGMDAYLDPDATGLIQVSGKLMDSCGCSITVEVTPDGETVTCAGNSILYTATATDGAPPYTYQWTEDGGDIPGATDSTFSPSYISAESHAYNCKVSDSGGCSDVEDSADSTGTWTDPLDVNVTPEGTTTVSSGMDIVFTATPVGGTGPYSYQWTEDGGDIPGETDMTLTMNYGSGQTHAYNCRISGSGDCTAVYDPVDSIGFWTGIELPPVADGVNGSGIMITKVSGTTLRVDFDIATCSADHTVILYGSLGSFGAYTAAVDSGCNAGSAGSADFDITTDNVWFNLVWVDPTGAAGHPGFETAGDRTLNAVGFCGVSFDNHSDTLCD